MRARKTESHPAGRPPLPAAEAAEGSEAAATEGSAEEEEEVAAGLEVAAVPAGTPRRQEGAGAEGWGWEEAGAG